MKRDTYEINCHCQGGTLTNVNELSACEFEKIFNQGTMVHWGQTIFRDPYLQCISREPVHTFSTNWILFSWYSDNASFPKDKRKMQKL